jgi:TP901 family phage tail tape measure protein
MGEMAVVTDLEVGDYWKQLPEHAQRAKDLGVAIKDVYEAETLYYQQGLKTEAAQSLANTTLKMASIAGLDAAEATDKMTAALRGFNMELNEASAERVADVYSELAAITAADVNEISSAMTKTASIAASAGMEFETTAAFLSQIIETTRESAETAGTAMKTVIARFSEVKKLQNEGVMSGQDAEGEVIDVNKIQTALRTVGISMEEFFNGTEGLD